MSYLDSLVFITKSHFYSFLKTDRKSYESKKKKEDVGYTKNILSYISSFYWEEGRKARKFLYSVFFD